MSGAIGLNLASYCSGADPGGGGGGGGGQVHTVVSPVCLFFHHQSYGSIDRPCILVIEIADSPLGGGGLWPSLLIYMYFNV